MRIMTLPRIFLLVLCGLASASLLSAKEASWSEDYAASVERAKQEKKPILLLFTGSDWCPPCKAMDSKVFASEAFGSYATENLVLVKADFPRRQPLAPEVKKQNDALAQSFGVQYFPTVVLLSPSGEVLGQTVGAKLNTPDAFLKMVREAVAKS
jgi:thiol-disulfide isomerase/thioredoxin